MFYLFRQNNSGGVFTVDEGRGIAMYVIVEAPTSGLANTRAEEIGLYFDGVEAGLDCECCGDRWQRVSRQDVDEVPSVYGDPVEEHNFRGARLFFPPEGALGFVHHRDGRVVQFPAVTS